MKKIWLGLLLAAVMVPSCAQLHAQGEGTATNSNATTDSRASGTFSEPEANSREKRREAEEGSAAFKKSPSVIAIGKKLGLSPAVASSTFEWLNFAVLAFALGYAVLKMLPKVFRGRTATIQKGIVEARSATEEARARMGVVEGRLAKLDEEISALKAQSEKDAATDEAKIKASIEEEKNRIVQSVEQEITAVQAEAERGLREFAAKLAVERAAADLKISDAQDSALVREFAGQLDQQNSGKGAN